MGDFSARLRGIGLPASPSAIALFYRKQRVGVNLFVYILSWPACGTVINESVPLNRPPMYAL